MKTFWVNYTYETFFSIPIKASSKEDALAKFHEMGFEELTNHSLQGDMILQDSIEVEDGED